MQEAKGFYEVTPVHNFKELLRYSVDHYSANTAFLRKDVNGNYFGVSYALFKREVDALGTALLSLGLKGKKVAVMGRNCYEWCVSYLAVTCGVGVVVPIDKELQQEDILNILHVSDCKAVIFDQKSGEKFLGGADRLPDVQLINIDLLRSNDVVLSFDVLKDQGYQLLERGEETYLNAEIDSHALGSLIFTSGTTGMAKGVMLSQSNICADILSVSQVVKVHPTDRTLSILPLHHTYECTLGFLMILYSGACISFCDGLRYVQKNMQQLQPTIFVSVPLMLEKMRDKILQAAAAKPGGTLMLKVGKAIAATTDALGVNNAKEKVFADVRDAFGGKLRLIIVGAAPLNPQVVKDFRSFGFTVLQGYGLTECAPLVLGNNDQLVTSDSVGIPIPGVEVRITNPNEEGVGELAVKGPNVMLGYYNDPESTNAVMKDGWFYTGDLVSRDAEGLYRIVGRSKNVIVTSNGKNIYPEEVEYYLNKSPFISESMVFGEAEENETYVKAKLFVNAEAVAKKLKTKAPTQEQIKNLISDTIKEINKKLPSYKKVKRFNITDSEFVKTTTQKIKRFIHMEKQ